MLLWYALVGVPDDNPATATEGRREGVSRPKAGVFHQDGVREGERCEVHASTTRRDRHGGKSAKKNLRRPLHGGNQVGRADVKQLAVAGLLVAALGQRENAYAPFLAFDDHHLVDAVRGVEG